MEKYEGLFIGCLLFRAENPVAGIAQTRADIGVFIKAAVEMTNINMDIRVRFMQALSTLRSRDDTHKFDFDTAVLFD